MLFWKVRTEPFAEAKTARKSIPIFITLLLAALLFYGFSKGFYFLYGKLFDFVQKQVALYKIDAELPLFDDLDLIIRSASTVFLVLFASLYVRFLEGRRLSTMGFRKKGLWGNILKGAAAGILSFGAILGILAFTGSCHFEGEVRSDLLTRMAGFLAILLGSFSFEFFFRGFVLTSLGARSRIFTAVFLTAVLSTAAQSYFWGYSFLSILNNLLLNILLGLLVVRTGSACTACSARTLFLLLCQFVFGTTYSGAACTHALVPVTVDYQSVWAGTANGIDSGYAFTLIFAIAALAVLFLPKKAPEEELESGPFFKHVPVEKQAAGESAKSSAPAHTETAEQGKTPVLRRPGNLAKAGEEAAQPAPLPSPDEEEEEWEEEEKRRPVDPNYKKPEDYLK